MSGADTHRKSGGVGSFLWAPPPVSLCLTGGRVHVWRAALDRICLNGSELDALDGSERERAARFRFDRDRRLFVTSHVLLRQILGRYLGIAPRKVTLDEGLHGKPFVQAQGSAGDVKFSMSHAKDIALYAVASGLEVGVDVEYMREDVDFDGVASRFFSPAEAEAVRSASGEHKIRTFFACWTRKEAVVKATGLGFSLPLGSFGVATTDVGHLMPVSRGPVAAAGTSWELLGLDAGEGYSAAVAFARTSAEVRCFDWPCQGDTGS